MCYNNHINSTRIQSIASMALMVFPDDPEAVHWWISCAHTSQPLIQDINMFAKEFWTWWCGLQPVKTGSSRPSEGHGIKGDQCQ